MRAVCMSMMEPGSRCWLGGCGLWAMVGLAAMFDSELKPRILFLEEFGCVFCCQRTSKKFPVRLFNCCNCLVHDFNYSARLGYRSALPKSDQDIQTHCTTITFEFQALIPQV
jgi:hypothetical protein